MKKLFMYTFLLLTVYQPAAFCMDTASKAEPVTFGCDWCQEQKTALTLHGPGDAMLGTDCSHVLCDACDEAIGKKYKVDDQFFWCRRCPAFYQEKHKVCWWPDKTKRTLLDCGKANSYTAGLMRKRLKVADTVNVRQLLDVTATTILPTKTDPSVPRKKGPFWKFLFKNAGIELGFSVLLSVLTIAARVLYKKIMYEEGTEDEADEIEDTTDAQEPTTSNTSSSNHAA